jgi:hypothetical protein
MLGSPPLSSDMMMAEKGEEETETAKAAKEAETEAVNLSSQPSLNSTQHWQNWLRRLADTSRAAADPA